MDASAKGSSGEVAANNDAGSNPPEGGSKKPQDDFGPRAGETDEEFFARKDEEGRVEFAAAVKAWRDDKANGGGQAKVLEARGGFSRSGEDVEDGGAAPAGKE